MQLGFVTIEFKFAALARRFAAGVGSRFFRSRDEGVTYFDSGFAWEPIGGNRYLELTAQEDIPAFSGVTLTGELADSTKAGQVGKIAGVTLAGALKGQTVKAFVEGEFSSDSWNWGYGDKLYINGKALSATRPGGNYVQQVARAVAPTRIQLDLAGASAVEDDPDLVVDRIATDELGIPVSDQQGYVLTD